MALVTPIVNNIPAFDATETTPITFTADGGSEIFKNEIKIVNNATDVIVYTNTITTHALGQSIPANTLVNGTYYKVAFRTYDAYDNVSEWSNYQPFYCYSTPTLSFNISDGDTLNTTSFDLKLTYNQAEDERLESAVIYFYDSADNLISTSGNLFNNNYPPIIFKYTLRSFENNKTYRVKADATTINGTSLTTGIISFSVSYQTVDNEGELYLTMDSCNGYINVRSAPVIDAVQGENRHNPAVLSYISDEMVDLTSVMGEIDTTNNYSSWIEWYDFSPVTNAFLFRLWFYPARVSFKIAEIISTDGDNRVTMTFRRGSTQDYIVITSTDGTRIAKELGTICNGNTKVFLWVKVVGNTWDVQTEILSNIETILDWNNTDNNISYNVTSDINYGNESYGDFIPRRNIYHALSGSYDKVIVGNGIFDALDLSININRPYSSEIPQHDISAVLFISFNGSITNHAPTGYTRAMLQRKDSSMITWFDLTETEIDTSISTELQYNDYLIPNGITQTYSLILYQGDTPSDAYTIDIVPKWGRVFLSDKDESYKLNYSVIYSNGSQNIQNGVLMPISATYPIVIQNAEGNYRSGSLQFKVLGYQFEIDKTLDRNSIVKQTNDILAFLTNGKVKCIKDYNGNIFICKVVNSPQISYDANWGNGIATISFDWVEQAKYNKYDEMVEANIIDNTIVPPTPEPVPTPTTPIEPFIERVYLPNGNSPDTIYPSQGIYAYTMYYGDNGTSSNTVNLYMPTNEYEIVSYKINNASQTIPQIQESGDELYYVLNFRTDSSSTDDSAVIVTVRDNNNNEISYTFNFVCTAVPIPPVVTPFDTATDQEITNIINAYYDGQLSLEDIQEVWHVGDTRNINLSAISASDSNWTVNESHRAQTVTIQILDFLHDTLASDNRKQALITVDLKECLIDDVNNYGWSNTEDGYMNSTETNNSGWESCARRAWCNNGFYNALPNYIKSLVKERMVNTYLPSYGHLRTTTDYVFLLSEVEVFGTQTYSSTGEGTQYNFYSLSTANKYKLPAWDNTHHNSSFWWLRSPAINNSERFCNVSFTGTADRSSANDELGIAPAFCM